MVMSGRGVMSRRGNARALRRRVNVYAIVSRAVEEGSRLGWRRAHKHTETPEEDSAVEAIERAILECLSEAFEW